MRPLLASFLLAPIALAAPALAQQAALPGASHDRPASTTPGPVSHSAPVNGVVTLFGNERCPTNAEGDEIVVCQRRSADEQFRVPKELREFQVTPANQSWAAKAQATLDTGPGVNTVGSCSAVGAGGQTGCFAEQARAARAENQARREADAAIP